MSVTVRLIFWGLVGFVPNIDLEKGMTAVLAKTGGIHDGQCHVPDHVTRVWLLDGECTGDCLREPQKERERTEAAGLPSPLDQMASTYKLRWWLDNEHLEIPGGSPGVSLERGTRPRVDGELIAFPMDTLQSTDFSWVPDLNILTSGHGTIDEDCLGEVTTCPISARFKIRSGRATACHLLHKTAPDGTDLVGVFAFKPPTGDYISEYFQAVADAVLVETTIEGSSVELQSWSFSRKDQKAKATLTPASGRNVVTLLIGHWENPNSPKPPATCRSRMLRRHSDVFFDLLGNNRQERVIRHFIDDTQLTASPGTCEVDLETFQGVIKDNLEDLEQEFPNLKKKIPPVWPHVSRECDTRQFNPSING